MQLVHTTELNNPVVVNKMYFLKLSKLIRVLIAHLLSFLTTACISTYFVTSTITELNNSFYFERWKFFCAMFFIGPSILGFGGTIRQGILVSLFLLRNLDINDKSRRDEVIMFIFFTSELLIAIIGLYFSGFIQFKYN